jgi:hypothetical protein
LMKHVGIGYICIELLNRVQKWALFVSYFASNLNPRRVETLKFDANLKYVPTVIIIDFGPDDEVLKQNDVLLFY